MRPLEDRSAGAEWCLPGAHKPGHTIDPKSDATTHGFNAKAEMLRFRDEHPGMFYGILRTRNNVKERLFFDKGGFGGVVRALKPHTQAVELLSMCICHHMSI